MTWEELNDLTVSNGAIDSLKKLIIARVFNNPELERFFTLYRNVHNGDKVGYLGGMSDVGWVGGGCEPTYRQATIQMLEKVWEIGKWEIPLKLCYEDLENTIAEYCLKTGTEIADLQQTEYMKYIFIPKLEEAFMNFLWRIIWFGDKAAALNTASGVITTGVDVDLFKTTDGLWKRLFAVGTASAEQKVAIAANNEASTALQLSKIKEKGVAIGIFDSLLENADPRIASMDGACVMATKTLTDALTKDLKTEYKEILTWEQVFKGLRVTEYNGIPIYEVSIWDRMIKAYQNNGTKLNIPHRAVFTAPSELLVGTPADSIISQFDNHFNRTTRLNHTYACGKIGTQIGQDDLIQMAY